MKKFSSIISFIAVLSAFILMSSPISARVIFVDVNSPYVGADPLDEGSAHSPFGSITEAVAASQEGDTIVVDAGTYNEDTGEVYPIYLEHSLAIIGRGADKTLVQITQSYAPFSFIFEYTANQLRFLVVDGIAFEGSLHSMGAIFGPIVDKAVVRNCSFTHLDEGCLNDIEKAGLEPSSSIEIVGNEAKGWDEFDCFYGYFYFSFAYDYDKVYMLDNELSDNYHALYKYRGSGPIQGRIEDNILTNWCSEALVLDVGEWTIANNVISGNLLNSGGVDINDPGDSKIINNTFHNLGRAIEAGGDPSGVDIINNIVSNNEQFGIKLQAGTMANIRHNNVYNNTGGNYVNIPDQTGINGNISVDPGLDPDNIHLTAGSQCIDAGEDVSWLLTTDIDHEQRVVPFDIGADEYQCVPEGSTERKKCTDGLDNDCDGLTDCDDPDCAADKACK